MDWAAVDVAVPHPAVRLPGVRMAGFRQRIPAPAELAMVAHPGVTLLVDLGDAGTVYDARGRYLRGSVAIGLAPGDLRAAACAAECLQIRLEPVTAAQLLGPSVDLSGTVAPLADLWDIEDRLRAAASWNERFAIAARLLAGMAHRPVDPEVAHAWRRTRAGRGRVRVESLADEVGWSRQRLWSRFRAQLGITPKRAARLVRFDHAAHLLAAGRPAADVAAGSGYVDQSHLHRDAREFTGLTPAAVAAAPWLAIDDVAWPTATQQRPTKPTAVVPPRAP